MADSSFISRVATRLAKAINPNVEIHKAGGRGGLAFRDIPLPFNSYVQMVGCYLPDTEIFTDKGWKRADSIDGTELIYSMNTETGEAEFYPIKEKYEYDYEGFMYAIGGENGLLLSPEHKMFGYAMNTKKVFEFPIKDIFKQKEGYFVKKAKWSGGKVPSDFVYNKYRGNRWGKISVKETRTIKAKDWFEFLGWFISEGHLVKGNDYQIRITQHKEEGRKKIEDVLMRCGFPIIHSGKQYVIKSKDIYSWLEKNCYDGEGFKSENKVIPREILESAVEYSSVFLQSYLEGDGHLGEGNTYVASTNSMGLVRGLDELGTKLGYDVYIGLHNYERTFDHTDGTSLTAIFTQYYVTFKHVRIGTNIKTVADSISLVYYKGKIYDVNVLPNHTILLKRGKVRLWTKNSSEKTPLYRWSYSWVMDLYYGSDVLRTIINSITDEAFKMGVEIQPRFVSKCTNPDCGYEMYEDRKYCPICGYPTRPPDFTQKMRAEAFLKRKNRFNADLIEVAKGTDMDLNIFDNGFILLTMKYLYDNIGNIVGAEIDDIVRLSPDKVKLVISNFGMGRGDNGSYIYVCPEHREKVVVRDRKGKYYCDIDHKELLECWFAANPQGSAGSGASGQNIYFGKNELIHLKRWSSQEGYGVSPIYTVWRKVLTLIKMDDYTLEAYSLQRTPRSFLIIRGKMDDVRRGFEYVMQKARENPNMIYPFVVEGTDVGTRRIAETVNLDLKPDEMQMLQMVELFRTHVGLVYGVQPMFSTGHTSGAGGLGNEGLEVTVTNRTVRETQRVWNKFFDWLTQKLNVTDFAIRLIPNEMEDEMRKIEMENARIEEAQKMQELGFAVDMEIDSQGMMKFRYRKIVEPNLQGGGGGEAGMPSPEAPPEEGASPEDILSEGEHLNRGNEEEEEE